MSTEICDTEEKRKNVSIEIATLLCKPDLYSKKEFCLPRQKLPTHEHSLRVD